MQVKSRKTMTQNLHQIDPTASKEAIQIFENFINEILNKAKIEDDKTDIVATLTKIEIRLMELCETRNFLYFKDRIMNVHHDKSIEQFEKKIHKKRMDDLIKENKPEKKR